MCNQDQNEGLGRLSSRLNAVKQCIFCGEEVVGLRLSKMDNSSWRRGSGQTESLEPTQGHQGHCSPKTFVRHKYANGNDSGHQLGANYDLTVSTTYYKLCNYNHTNENKSTYPWNKLDYGCLMLSCKLIDYISQKEMHIDTHKHIHTHTHIYAPFYTPTTQQNSEIY